MPLRRVLERVRAHAEGAAHAAGGGRPVVVFDLDWTLLSSRGRNFAILQEYLALEETPAALRVAAGGLSAADMTWNVMADLERAGYGDREALAALRRFWLPRFFHDDYCRHDEPLAGAREFVCAVHGAGAVVFYLSARVESMMGRGTRATLSRCGFPLDEERAVLRLKARFEDEDVAYKRAACADALARGAVVAAFENEPANANLFVEAFPGAEVFLVETYHSPRAPALDPRVVRLRDFDLGHDRDEAARGA